MDARVHFVFVAFIAFFVALYVLYEAMVLRVNRHLPPGQGVSLVPLRDWVRLMSVHAQLYPRSVSRKLVVACAMAALLLAAVLVVVRLWLYLKT